MKKNPLNFWVFYVQFRVLDQPLLIFRLIHPKLEFYWYVKCRFIIASTVGQTVGEKLDFQMPNDGA